MEFLEHRIIVKSTDENFANEKSGYKNNTVRAVYKLADMFSETNTKEDKEKNKEYENMNNFINKLKADDPCRLVIRNINTGEFIEKIITDITIFRETTNEAIFIISFRKLGEN